MPWIYLIAITVGAAAFFFVQMLQYRSQYKSMTRTAQREADYAAEEKLRAAGGLKGRLRLELVKRGYRGDITPALTMYVFGYLLTAIALKLFGISGLLGVLIAVPTSLAACVGILGYIARKRRREFSHQLAQMLVLLASQIESGVGSARALNIVVPNVGNPLREEMSQVLAAVAANKDLVTGMKELAERYPSRALQMFISALEIDRDQGGRIAPALRQAAAILQRDFDLAAEAEAEVSQAKSEFYGIVGIIGMITVTMFRNGGQHAQEAYFSPLGIGLLVFFGANFAFGLFRAMRLFSSARGDV